MSNTKKIELKDIESFVPNHLQDKSPRLIDIFMILGYEHTYIVEQIIADINKKISKAKNQKDNGVSKENEDFQNNSEEINKDYSEYKCLDNPTVLSSIASDLEVNEENYNFYILDFQFYLELFFPIPPVVYYVTDKQKINRDLIKPKELIPSIITNDATNSCYAYMFYEEKQYDKITIYIPKVFCIISKYQYYRTFHEICLNIYEIFKSSKVQIPLEIQLYNIVNYTPAPTNCKLQLCLFPDKDLNNSKISQTSIDIIDNNKIFILNRLSGYPHTQLSYAWIFKLFSVETIIELYFQLRLYTPIAFFSEDLEQLFILMNILRTLLYPIIDEEKVIIISFNDFIDPDSDKNIFTFFGVKVDNIRATKEYLQNQKNYIPKFYPNFYLILDQNENKLVSTFEEIKNKAKINEKIETMHAMINSIINEQPARGEITRIIKNLKENLKKINNKINSKNITSNYYESNDEIEINIEIRNIFYKLNLEISNFIYNQEKSFESVSSSELKTSLSINEEQLNQRRSSKLITFNPDELFYQRITNCFFNDILKYSCCDTKDEDSKNMKLCRKIFASFLSQMRENKGNKEIDYFRIIDSIYYKNNPKNSIQFDFHDFYKYFYLNFNKYFSDVYNPKYVECKPEEVDKDTVKHYYCYKKIELDPELIMKYLCVLERMERDEDTKKEKQIILPTENLVLPKDKTKNIEIFNAIENYYIEKNLIDSLNMIKLCLIYYIILSIPKKNLVFFNKEESLENGKKKYKNFVYEAFNNNQLFLNKFIEMFLSVSYRYFNNTNETNYFIIQPYIDLYDNCAIKRGILRNEEMADLYNKFTEFSEKIKEYNATQVVTDEKNKYLINHDPNTPLYEFKKNSSDGDIIKKFNENGNGELIQEKVELNCDYIHNSLSYESIHSPKELYHMIQTIMNKFYESLDLSDSKEKIQEIGFNLLFYCYIIKASGQEKDIPFEINKFILANINSD